jgi:hypothetical protein
MSKKTQRYVLKKDIIIPAGTVLNEAPSKMEFCDGSHRIVTVGLTNDTCGSFIYPVHESGDDLSEYFIPLLD